MKSPRVKIKTALIWRAIFTLPLGLIIYISVAAIAYPLLGTEKQLNQPIIFGTALWIVYIWANFLTKYANRNTKDYAIFKISEIINFRALSQEDTQTINNSEGWDFDDHKEIKLNEIELKQAYELATKQSRKQINFTQRNKLIFAILSFLFVPYGFAGGILVMRGGDPYPPFWSGFFFLGYRDIFTSWLFKREINGPTIRSSTTRKLALCLIGFGQLNTTRTYFNLG